MAKKVTVAVATFGALGLSALGYALLRRPRHLYDGQVAACEGNKTDCSGLFLTRGSASGKVFAPFTGRVVLSSPQHLVIASDSQPVSFTFDFKAGTPVAQRGAQVKAGDLIAQADSLVVKASRREGNVDAPMAPTTWLVANALRPASQKGDGWCEDTSNLIVPRCAGVTFAAPELPRYSFRTVRMSIS